MTAITTALCNPCPFSIPEDETAFPADSENFPEELWMRIFAFLPVFDVTNVSSVCWDWSRLANDDRLWRHLFERDLPLFSLPKTTEITTLQLKSHYRLCSNLNRGAGKERTLNFHYEKIANLFLKDETLFSCSKDLTIKIFDNIADKYWVLRDPPDGPYNFAPEVDSFTSLVLNNQHLFSGSLEGFIKIWSTRKNSCIYSKRAHEQQVSALIYADNVIYSGCADGSIKMWNTESLDCLRSFLGHTGRIKFLIFTPHGLCSGSSDGHIKVWDPQKGTCLRTLSRPSKVTALIYAEDSLFAGYDDGEIHVWDPKTGTSLHTFTEHTTRVSALLYSDGLLYSGECNGTIKVSKIGAKTCLHTLQGHTGKVTALILEECMLFSSSCDKTVKVWNWMTATLVKTLSGHTDRVTSLTYENGVLASGSWDNTIHLWNFNPPALVTKRKFCTLF